MVVILSSSSAAYAKLNLFAMALQTNLEAIRLNLIFILNSLTLLSITLMSVEIRYPSFLITLHWRRCNLRKSAVEGPHEKN